MSDKHNKNHNKSTTATIQSPEELDKQLGKNVSPNAQPEVKKPEAQPVNELDKFVKVMSETHRKIVKALMEKPDYDKDLILEIAKGYSKADNPMGNLDQFKAGCIKAVEQQADENLVDVLGKEILIRFPTTEGTQFNAEVAVVGTYYEKTSKSRSGGEKREWGESTVTDEEGKVKAYEKPSAMAKAVGLRITGHPDTLHVFSHPKKAEGLDWEKNWTGKTITVTSGDLDNPSAGIHIKLS